jgi:hypothetical protein
VCLSACKLLKRIVHSDDIDYRLDSNEGEASKIKKVAEDLHNHTYGISSDPLTYFTVVFSALVHDVGHTGVPNNQLAKGKNQPICERCFRFSFDAVFLTVFSQNSQSTLKSDTSTVSRVSQSSDLSIFLGSSLWHLVMKTCELAFSLPIKSANNFARSL